MSADLYTPAEFLDPHPVAPYTWEQLEELIEHHRKEEGPRDLPVELRELGDGRVVDAAWSPADTPSPVVYAERVSS